MPVLQNANMPTQPQGDPSTPLLRAPRHELRNAEDEAAHIVCCRDPEWRVSFCGEPGDSINLAARTLCSMCVEIALQRLPSFFDNDPTVCPLDLTACPDEHDIDLRILSEVAD